jgi:hypothetical protein
MDERFLPGPMITDVAPHLLKENEWQEVINLRMTKAGAMESVERLHDSIAGTDIRAMAEFTEDKSGDRFILYQDGTKIYRVDYDDGDGDGYENETPVELTLPSGVTIPDVTCRFFFYRGVVRIIGPIDPDSADCPLWYGYIDREILTDAYEKLDEDGFEADTESWAANGSAAVTSESVSLTPVGSKCLQIDQNGNLNASARKSWSVPAGVKIRVRLSARRADDVSGLNGDLLIKVGSTAGGAEYGTIRRGEIALADGAQTNTGILIKDWADMNYGDIFDTSHILIGGEYRSIVDAVGFPGITLTLDDSVTVGDGDHVYPDWRYLELEDFVTTGTTLHVEIIPGEGESNAIALVDHFQVLVQSPVVLDGWYLEPAHLDVVELTGAGSVSSPWGPELPDSLIRFPRISTIFDRAQYSLPWGGDPGEGLLTQMNDAGYAVNDGAGVSLRLPGANLKVAANFPNKRMTGFWYAEADEALDNTKTEDELTFYNKIYMDFLETQSAYKYARSGDHKKFYHYNTYPCRLYLTNDPLDETVLGDNYLVAGRKVTFHSIETGVSQGSAVVVTTGFDDVKDLYYIDFSTPIRRFFGELQDVASAYVETVVEVERITDYNASTGYDFLVVFAPTDQDAEFYETTGIPAGTETLNCEGSWVDFIQERAFMVSEEEGEEDQLRYSPPYQPDSFPNTYKTPNKTGDADRNRVVLNIGDRVVLLKENVVSQVQFSGGSFYLDIALARRGLYPLHGFLVLDGILFFMDRDDAYRFQGGVPEPVISKAGLRTYYRAHVGTDSFVAYDRGRKEIWFVLDSQHILVWQLEFDNWFVRECGTGFIGAVTNYDGSTIFFAATKLITIGSKTDDDESIRVYMKGREIGKSNPTKFKKVLRSLIDGYSEGGYLRMVADGTIENAHALALTETAITEDNFEAGTWTGWAGTDATLSAEADGSPEGKLYLKIASTVNGGLAKRTFTVTDNAIFKLNLLYLMASTGRVRVGTVADDDYYGEFTQSGIYWNVARIRATASGTSVVVTVIPDPAGTNNAHVDAVQCVVEDMNPGFQEFDEGVMFHKLYPEIVGANSDQKQLKFNSLILNVKDWNLARKTG